ncbi:MAG TPA: thiolase family protein [Pseudonocardiaceae bacterium]|jgi:acetyl-CoA C-acetyltransferase
MPEALIVTALRTPIGRASKGSLRDVRPDDLVAGVIAETVRRSGIDPALIADHALGTAYPEGKQGANLARRASLLAGLPVGLPGSTINRFCASSLQAVRVATHALWSGEADAYLVSGVESISQVGRTTKDEDKHPAFTDGPLSDVYVPMGITAENVAEQFHISRQAMDEFALHSHRKAVAATDAGVLARDILPVRLPDGTVVGTDDGPRRDTSLERLATLQPVFRDGGSVTAGNSCPLNDGAAAAIMVTSETAEREGLTPRARVLHTAVSGVDPSIMGVGPIEAIREVLRRAKLTIADIDVVEFNEAFAAQVLAVSNEIGIDPAQLNPSGGAIALGHPFGMTGIRLLCNLLTNLDERSGRYGLATLCVGGGQGMAVLVERL